MTTAKFESTTPDDPRVKALYGAFIRETDGPLGIDLEAEIAAGPPRDLMPPVGTLLLLKVDAEPAGLGGVRHLDTQVAEVKSMYVAPAYRGKGLAQELLGKLEQIARQHGCTAVRLDTSDYLTEAIGLYRAGGYREVADYNGNPKASLWFERSLDDEPIRISSYNPRWPALFASERAVLEAALGDWIVAGVHHVGSTAVPGLDAKPIIDILVGVEDLETSRACFPALADLDYLHAPYRSEEMHWFCKPDPGRRTHHLHLVPAQSRRFVDELAFRDILRTDAAVAEAYASLKRELATRFKTDRKGYTEAKTDFIRATLDNGQL